MSDLTQIFIGIGIIAAVLLFIVWHFRAPPGIGKGKTNREENIRMNSSGQRNLHSMFQNDKDHFH